MCALLVCGKKKGHISGPLWSHPLSAFPCAKEASINFIVTQTPYRIDVFIVDGRIFGIFLRRPPLPPPRDEKKQNKKEQNSNNGQSRVHKSPPQRELVILYSPVSLFAIHTRECVPFHFVTADQLPHIVERIAEYALRDF
mgnify:FL=1